MPTITFISTSSPNTPIKSVDFGQCALGLQTPKMLTYTVTTDEPDQTFVGTLKMLPGSGGSNTVFVASLVSQILSVSPGHIGTTALPSSGTNPTIGATTSGASGSTNQYTFSAVTPSSALLARPPYTYGITIDFSPPDTPLPAVWTATLQIYWTPPNQTDAVLLAELSLTGKTAQLTMNVTTPGAIELNPGSTVTVPLRLEYDSVDDATISVNIGPSTVFGFPDYAGLDIHKATVDMPATYVTGFVPMNHHSHIVGSIGGSGGSGVVQNQRLLQLHRIVDSKVEISTEETVQPGKNKTTYIGYTAPFISAAVGGPNACPVIFDIAPAPITFSIKDKQPIDIIRGRSASVDISVSYNGCPTNLIFDQPNGQPPIKITSSTTFGIGFNSNTEVSLIISAADDATTTTTEQVTIEIPWTANDGLSKSTLKVSLNILPGVKIFSDTLTTPTLDLTCSAQWILYQNGLCLFQGDLTNTFITDEFYYFSMATIDRIGQGQGQGQFLTVITKGKIDDSASFQLSGSNKVISDNWVEILNTPVKMFLSTDSVAVANFFGAIGVAVADFFFVIGSLLYVGILA